MALRNTASCTTSQARRFRFVVEMLPATEKVRSEDADVAGMQSIRLAITLSIGRKFYIK